MQLISFIIQQNLYLIFLQSLFFCLLNLYFSSQMKSRPFVTFFIVISMLFPFLYIRVNFYATILIWMFLILFNKKWQKFNLTYSILYATLPIFLLIFSDYIIEMLFQTIFSHINIAIPFRVLSSILIGCILAILIRKILIRLSTDSNYEIFKRILCAFLLFTVCIYYVLISMNRFLEDSAIDFRVHTFLLLFYSCLSIFLCTITLFMVRRRTDMRLKRMETEQLLLYTQQLEQNYIEIRNFKHDYKNILLSIEILIRDGDIKRLAQYYEKYIEPTKQEIEAKFSCLTDLSLVKKPEIKSILFSKLMRAQTLGIEVKFDCYEEIVDFHIDSLILIRSLGILLDNAIEEIMANADTGEIIVTCIQQENSIQISICNTCRDDLPPIYQVKQEGFSTKEGKRSLGLSNLKKLLTPLKNVSLDTQYKDGKRTQTIEITDIHSK